MIRLNPIHSRQLLPRLPAGGFHSRQQTKRLVFFRAFLFSVLLIPLLLPEHFFGGFTSEVPALHAVRVDEDKWIIVSVGIGTETPGSLEHSINCIAPSSD
ncbi:hypothetical protein [Dyadobacter sp. CY343]|uniref:hypothetical protein n=1 Tax=Dyadobacter sp. CY343 TaxID=2907299 RepID=UPI001F46327B|nr:hypothetical protein [Dyadobacter sp. CY343]MCE7060845.1 hypothetical protein [Dyadobacter sp. CY343]